MTRTGSGPGAQPGRATDCGQSGRTWRHWRARLVVAAPLLLLLTGPGPGAVGSCAGGDDLAQPADFQAYCEEREQLVCERRKERGEITAAAAIDCRRRAIELCGRRSFAAGCSPTRREANACLNALYSLSTLESEVDELEECRDLCSLPAGAGSGPQGLGDPDAGSDAGADAGMGEP